MADQELKACAHCGGKAEFDRDDNGYHWVFCTRCSISTDTARYGEAATAWNTRADPASMPTVQAGDGWKLVPMEPTLDMVLAGEDASERQIMARLEDPNRKAYPSEESRELASRVAYRAMLAAAPSQPVAGKDDLLKWAVDKWYDEVSNRPVINVHRRSLDDTWRQVIRKLGGDDVLLCGLRHDDLLTTANTSPSDSTGKKGE